VLDKIVLNDLHQDILDLLNAGADTIYTADGSLQSERNIQGNGYGLWFKEITEFGIHANNVRIDTPQTLFTDQSVGVDSLFISAENFTKYSLFNGLTDAAFAIYDSGALNVKTYNDNINDFVQRFYISGNEEVAMVSVLNANFEIKDNNNNRWFQTDLVNQILVFGDGDLAQNGTQIILSDTAQQVFVSAQEGFAIHASNSFFNNSFAAILKTDNLTDGDCVLQLPFSPNHNLATNIDGFFANAFGKISLTEEDVYTPVITGANNASFIQSNLRYLKIRNTVIVSGFIECTTTNSSVFGSFNFTLPIDTTINNAGGTSAINNTTSNNISSISIEISNGYNNLAHVTINSPLGGQKKYYFTLTYKI
jgi:hypothetical protein